MIQQLGEEELICLTSSQQGMHLLQDGLRQGHLHRIGHAPLLGVPSRRHSLHRHEGESFAPPIQLLWRC